LLLETGSIRSLARGRRAEAVVWLLAVGLVGLAWISCGGETDPIQRLLNDVEDAVEDRSVDGVAAHLSAGFRGSGGITRADALATLRRYMAGYQTIRLEIYDIQVDRAEATATVGLTAEFSGDARRIGGLSGFLPPAALYRFDLELSQDGDRWLIAAAEWKALPPPEM
jgi:hypothetical protein